MAEMRSRFRGRRPRIGGCCGRLWRSCSSMMRILFSLLFITIFMLGTQLGQINQLGQWYILFWYGLFILLLSQWASGPGQFFLGEGPYLLASIRKVLCDIEEVDDFEGGIDHAEDETAKPVSFWILAPSVFVSWLFSRSLRDGAYLAGQYGMFGAVACSGWYASYITAALLGYILRTRYKFHSLSMAIGNRFGSAAVWAFSFALIYRLLNDLWRNVAIISSFFEILAGSDPLAESKENGGWWVCLIAVVLISLLVAVIGGLRASLSNSRVHAAVACAFCAWLLYMLHKSFPGGLSEAMKYNTSFTINNAGDLWMTTLLQGMLSYPFHDPILTDRSFLGRPRTMLWSFISAAVVAVFFLVAFSLLGVFGMFMTGPSACLATSVVDGRCGEPSAVAKTFIYNSQPALFLSVVTIIMLSTTIAAMDAAFTAIAKVFVLELGGFTSYFRTNGDKGPLSPRDPQLDASHVWSSRGVMMIISLLAVLPFAAGSLALDNAIITGTTVIGLGPPVFALLFWRDDWHPSTLCFHLSFWGGVVIGIIFQVNVCPVNGTCGEAYTLSWFERAWWALGTGNYRHLLGVNFWSLLICISLSVLGFMIDQIILKRGDRSGGKQYVSGWLVLAGGISIWMMVVMCGLVVSYWQAQAVGVLVALGVGLLAVASVMCLGMSLAFGPEQQLVHEVRDYEGVQPVAQRKHRRQLTGDSIGDSQGGKMQYDLHSLEPDPHRDDGYQPPREKDVEIEDQVELTMMNERAPNPVRTGSSTSIPPLEVSSEASSAPPARSPLRRTESKKKSPLSSPTSRNSRGGKDPLSEQPPLAKAKSTSRSRRDRDEFEEDRYRGGGPEYDDAVGEMKGLVNSEAQEIIRSMESSEQGGGDGGDSIVKVHRSPTSDPSSPSSPRNRDSGAKSK